MKNDIPFIIKGGKYIDDRGELNFFNDFNMSLIKRVYFTTHFKTNIVRAWQGHKIESRWFCCVNGSFIVKLIEIDNWDCPSNDLKVLEYKLTANKKEILYIPKGYLNGFRASFKDSQMMIMSNYRLNEIDNDQVRFDQNKWTKW